jgi:hypothetical protein
MLVLSALEYGSVAYGSASDGQLKRLEPMHNTGIRMRSGLSAYVKRKTYSVNPASKTLRRGEEEKS